MLKFFPIIVKFEICWLIQFYWSAIRWLWLGLQVEVVFTLSGG